MFQGDQLEPGESQRKKQRRFQSASAGKALINRSDGLCLGTTGEYVMPNLTFLTWWPDHVNSQRIIFKWRQKNVIFMVWVGKHSSLKRCPRHRSKSGLVVVKRGHKNYGDAVVKFYLEWTSSWDQYIIDWPQIVGTQSKQWCMANSVLQNGKRGFRTKSTRPLPQVHLFVPWIVFGCDLVPLS